VIGTSRSQETLSLKNQGETIMKHKITRQTAQYALYLAVISSLLLAVSISAFAIPPAQVGRTSAVQTISDSCVPTDCVGIQPTVSVTEPANVTPVIVTWSADYNTSGTSVVYMSLNGGACDAYGPFTLQEPQLIAGSNSFTVATTHQWVVLPSDGLVEGKNTFQVCTGGYEESQTINIGFSTLTVQTE
jgi:hypothetical protein